MPDPHEEPRDTADQQKAHQELIREFLAKPKIGIENIPGEHLNRYELAFTHRSVNGEEKSYERLEWLGDRVLNLVVSTYLYEKNDGEPKDLSRKMECVSNDNIQKVIEEELLIPDTLIQTGKGTLVTPNIRADVFEALVGAIYLHLGFDGTKDVILPLIGKKIKSFDSQENYKGRLQEVCQSRYLTLPKYEEEKREGPDDAPIFYCDVKIGDEIMGKGKGSRIPIAEQEAAKMALEEMEKITNIE